MVLEAFVGPCPEDKHGGLHWDDDKDNNTLSNLRWGTMSENMQDQLRNGVHGPASQTECKRGHAFTPDNTLGNGQRPQRLCRTCRNIWKRNAAAAKREKQLTDSEAMSA
jgi:hypothetical protein